MTETNPLSLRLLAPLVAFLLIFGAPAAAAQESPTPDDGGAELSTSDTGGNGGDNLALAVNTKDDSSVVKFAFEVRRVMNEVVDETNAAVAVSSCEDCRTVAVAIQIVLIVNDPEIASPTNLALAMNIECTSCETLASAYQYVFTTGGQLMFSKDGWDSLTDLRKQIHDLLKDESLDLVTLQTEIDLLAEEVYQVVVDELRPADEVMADEAPAPEDTATPAPQETTTAETSTSPEPASTQEGSTEASPSPSP